MRPKHRLVVFVPRKREVPPASDVGAESSFWADLLEGEVVVPAWSDPAVRQQVHLDLEVDDPRAAEAEVLAKGARLLLAAHELAAAEGFRAYADPAGHPFCLTWGQA